MKPREIKGPVRVECVSDEEGKEWRVRGIFLRKSRLPSRAGLWIELEPRVYGPFASQWEACNFGATLTPDTPTDPED